jgi:protein-S-isoprenylcysteine O-methyltransferase Ste14
MKALTTIAWLACCVYASVPSFWLLIHPYTDRWRQRHRERKPVYKLLVPAWVGMWILLGLLTYPLHHFTLYRNVWSWLPALAFFAAGIFLYLRARSGFSPFQLSGHHELQPEQHRQKLVISGVRERVRHPIYLGHVCELLGWSIGTGLLACWALTGFALVSGIIMVRAEERELVERFGDSYRDYQKKVPMLIPRVFTG